MNSRYFWAWIMALIGLVAAPPSSGTLTVVIDGQHYTGNTVTISDSGTITPPPSNGGGGTTNPPPNNSGGGTTNPPPSGNVCSGDLKLHQLALPEGLKKYTLGIGEAYAFGFQVSPGQRGMLSYGASSQYGNGYSNKQVTVSSCPGDFSAQSGACVRTNVNEGGIYVVGGGGRNAASYYCDLVPNTTYYLNIRNNQDTCDSNCGFSLNANWN